MPTFPIVDTHVHLWDPKRLRYPWLDGIAALNRPFGLADYRKACGAVKVEAMVFVQCEVEFAQAMEEVEWVLGLARGAPRLKGLVPWAPLENGTGAEEYLENLVRCSPLIKGVRRLIQSETEPGFCLQRGFVQGVRSLARYNLSFDLCISHRQLADTVGLVRQCPNVTFVLDHIGKPDIKGQVTEPWRSELRDLADLPNVVCKVSGLVTEADVEKWTREDLRPYLDHVLACFGFDRVLFGSDWPVVTLAAEYPRWVTALDWALAGCSAVEKRKIFRDNAVRFYRL